MMSRYKTKAEERADYLGYQRGYHAGVKKSVKRGWWVEEERPTCYVYRCTICGDEFDAPYNYCPNCGARMSNEDQHK